VSHSWSKFCDQPVTPGQLRDVQREIRKDSSRETLLHEIEVRKIGDFWPLSYFISKSVQDKTKAAIDHEEEVAYAL